MQLKVVDNDFDLTEVFENLCMKSETPKLYHIRKK